MSDIKLFNIAGGEAVELSGSSVLLERSLQSLIEQNLESLIGVRLLESEYSTGKTHGGRIDTLGIDENSYPVIIEYKRSQSENVINQGLFYLDWLLDHQAEFQLLVRKRIGQKESEQIEWASPRLLCIASNFTKYDEHAVQQITRNIELIRYRQFVDDLLLLELVNATTAGEQTVEKSTKGTISKQNYKTVTESVEDLVPELRAIYEDARTFILSLGDDVQEKTLKYYVAFRRLKNFVCVEAHPIAGYLKLYLKLDPSEVDLVEGFTRDVREIGHLGTGDLEVVIRTRSELQRTKAMLQQSYEAN